MQIILPYPPAILNPNRKAHWGEKSRAAKRYRGACYVLTQAKGKVDFKGETIPLKITFFPPDNHKRDDDNMVSAFKPGRDGIAEAWGVNDSLFKIQVSVGEAVKGGQVVVEV